MILNKFEAKIDFFSHSTAPDVYKSSNGQRPPDEFVISRHRNGGTASQYRDLSWNISAWHPEGRLNVLYFNYWGASEFNERRELISRDSRWLMFSLVWLRDGPPLSVGTLKNYIGIINALARHSENSSCDLLELLSSEKQLEIFVNNHCSANRIKLLCGLLVNLTRVSEDLLGFRVVRTSLHKAFRSRARNYGSNRQHPPIPTRLYSTILSLLEEELSEWERISPEILSLLQKCGRDPLLGRNIDSQRQRRKCLALESSGSWQPEWADISSPALRAYLKKKGLANSVKGLGSITTEMQLVAKLTIQAFSGMRDDESLSLPYACLDEIVSGGRVHRVICGRTTKLSNGPKGARWVTNSEGHRAVKIAQKIAKAIYFVCDTVVSTTKLNKNRKGNRPLFVSVAYLGFEGRTASRPTDNHFFPGHLTLENVVRLRKRLQPAIEEGDLAELEKIDAHRAWRLEESFKIGLPWTLTTHQLRRSLAIYAQRSGIVSLQSLRQQLQHITDEMTRYYARGSEHAKEIFSDGVFPKNHFSFEWQSTQVESEAISYGINVLLTNDTLFGGHAAFVQHRLKANQGIVSAAVRSETVRMFKKGLLHYRETLLGGCTRADECDMAAISWLNTECISNNCRNMVGNFAKLENVIVEQQRLMLSIDPESLMYRTEAENLEVLLNARENVRRKENGFEK